MIVGAVQMLLGGSAKDYWFGIFSRTAGGNTNFYKVAPLGSNLILAGRTNSKPTIFSISNTSAVNWVTSTFPTTDSGGTAEGVFVSSSNVIYTAGRSSGNTNNNDTMLASLTSAGALSYFKKGARSAGAEEFITGLASDGTSLFVNGMHGFTSFDDANSLNQRQMYVAKYNTAGSIQWENNIGSSTQDYGSGVGVDSSSNVYSAGISQNGGSLNNGFLVKYDTSGSLQWQKLLTESGQNTSFQGISVSSTGDSYVVGYRVANNPLIVKYSSSGSLSFQRQLLFSSNYGSFNNVFLAADGFVYAVGYAQASVYTNGLIAKYNTSGTLQWQRTIVYSTANVNLLDLTVSAEGVMYVVGNVGNDGFIAALPSDGTKTGTYGNYTYAASSFTDQSTSLTDSTPSFSSSTASFTHSAPSTTTASETITVTKQSA